MIILLLVSYFVGSDKVSPHVVGLIVTLLGLLWFWKRHQRNKRLKGLKEFSGPRGLPILGNIFQVMKPGQFSEWVKEYGDMYQVRMGPLRSIVISDPKLCKEIFSNDPALTGRMTAPDFSMYPDQPGLGISNSEGQRWEVHRQFVIRQLRDFGFGKSSMETLVMDEVNQVLSMYKSQCGKPIREIREHLRLAVVNSLWMIVSSQRYDHDDPKLLHLANNTTKAVNDVISKGGLIVYFPWLKYVVPGLSGYNQVRSVVEENRRIFEETVRQHKDTFREDTLRDFIDVYLLEMKKAENDNESFFNEETAERHLVATLFDLFFAGSDTTATTIAWSILYLCKFPRVQEKLQKEIDEVVGDKSVSVSDRPLMPYTQATIDEILRFSSIAPDGFQHRAMADREFHGYFIPKGALIQPNLMHIHYNAKWFEDPEQFKPERFLSSDGKSYVLSEYLMPFQIGKRQCVGESLARDTIFLYLTNIFRTFDIKFDASLPEPGIDSEIGFFRTPLPFSVIMHEHK